MSIGDRINELRLDKRWTLGALFKASGVSVPYLSQIENGEAVPSRDKVKSIAEALGKEAVLLPEFDKALLESWGYPPEAAEVAVRLLWLDSPRREELIDALRNRLDQLEQAEPSPLHESEHQLEAAGRPAR